MKTHVAARRKAKKRSTSNVLLGGVRRSTLVNTNAALPTSQPTTSSEGSFLSNRPRPENVSRDQNPNIYENEASLPVDEQTTLSQTPECSSTKSFSPTEM